MIFYDLLFIYQDNSFDENTSYVFLANMIFTQYYFLQATPTLGSNTVTSKGVVAKETNGTQSSSTGGYMQLFFPVVLIVILYFLLIRPQQKKEKAKKAMLKELKKGDKVVTRGGIFGVVTGLNDENDICTVKIADKVNIELSISAIEVVNPQKNKVNTK